jgi:hemin uptake protein HemP
MSASDRIAVPRREAAEAAEPAAQRRRPTAADSRRWSSTELFGACSEIEIEHGAAVYRLRQTSLGKLILTK